MSSILKSYIRTVEFKYNHNAGLGEELYDLRNDPDELANRAADPKFQRVKQDLKAALERWIKDNGDPYHSFTRAGKPGGQP